MADRFNSKRIPDNFDEDVTSTFEVVDLKEEERIRKNINKTKGRKGSFSSNPNSSTQGALPRQKNKKNKKKGKKKGTMKGNLPISNFSVSTHETEVLNQYVFAAPLFRLGQVGTNRRGWREVQAQLFKDCLEYVYFGASGDETYKRRIDLNEEFIVTAEVPRDYFSSYTKNEIKEIYTKKGLIFALTYVEDSFYFAARTVEEKQTWIHKIINVIREMKQVRKLDSQVSIIKKLSRKHVNDGTRLIRKRKPSVHSVNRSTVRSIGSGDDVIRDELFCLHMKSKRRIGTLINRRKASWTKMKVALVNSDLTLVFPPENNVQNEPKTITLHLKEGYALQAHIDAGELKQVLKFEKREDDSLFMDDRNEILNKDNVFSLYNSKQVHYYFAATSSAQKKKWINLLQSIIRDNNFVKKGSMFSRFNFSTKTKARNRTGRGLKHSLSQNEKSVVRILEKKGRKKGEHRVLSFGVVCEMYEREDELISILTKLQKKGIVSYDTDILLPDTNKEMEITLIDY